MRRSCCDRQRLPIHPLVPLGRLLPAAAVIQPATGCPAAAAAASDGSGGASAAAAGRSQAAAAAAYQTSGNHNTDSSVDVGGDG